MHLPLQAILCLEIVFTAQFKIQSIFSESKYPRQVLWSFLHGCEVQLKEPKDVWHIHQREKTTLDAESFYIQNGKPNIVSS